ncbi:MAG: hypothetical protein B6U87_02760 [Candidatus Aenigmarchaeota archaeon ex4484_52]|nr:MAG: hypothetical protein B6U87_02760 [Candidatus Aenigmarchaeota archaeon ex4484_52]
MFLLIKEYMTILGLNYTKLNIETKQISHRGISINTTPKILNVTKTQIQAGKNQIPIVVIDFSFTSQFNPKIANLVINGNIVFQPKDESKTIDSWKKTNKLPREEEVEIINYLFVKITPFALFLSEIFRIPPIIALPKIELKQEKKEEVKK